MICRVHLMSGQREMLSLTELVALLVKRGVIVVGGVQADGDLSAFPVGIPGVIAAEPARMPARRPTPPTTACCTRPGATY